MPALSKSKGQSIQTVLNDLRARSIILANILANTPRSVYTPCEKDLLGRKWCRHYISSATLRLSPCRLARAFLGKEIIVPVGWPIYNAITVIVSGVCSTKVDTHPDYMVRGARLG